MFAEIVLRGIVIPAAVFMVAFAYIVRELNLGRIINIRDKAPVSSALRTVKFGPAGAFLEMEPEITHGCQCLVHNH